MPEPWNINIHYDALLERLVPDQARSVLDVGCGDGFLSARLARRGLDVVAVDVNGPVVARARARFPDEPVDWVVGDVMALPLAAESFDVVLSNATLHHLGDAAAALERLGELVRPGGRLAAVTFVRSRWIDLPWQAVAVFARWFVTRWRGQWPLTAPMMWPPPDTLATLRRKGQARLPGAHIRRHWFGRVVLAWERPTR